MKKVAVLALNNPFSLPYDGGKIDIKSRIISLASTNKYLIDLYSLGKDSDKQIEIDKNQYHINNFFYYSLKKTNLNTFFSFYPMSVKRRMIFEMINELKKHQYDAIIYEGEYMALYRIKNLTNANKHILRMHNIESNYRKELRRSNKSFIIKIVQHLEALKYQLLEKKIFNLFDAYLFISDEEKEIISKSNKQVEDKSYWMCTSFDIHDYQEIDNSKTILYYGSLDIMNNYLSVKWFAEKVFSLIDKDLKFKIIGKINSKEKEELEAISPNIEVCGYVDDLEKEIREAALITAPVFYGSGVKVKIIEALSYGKIVCSNNKAIEGTKLIKNKDIFISDDPLETAQFCLEVIKKHKHKEIGRNGYNYFKKYHSIEHQASILEKLIDN